MQELALTSWGEFEDALIEFELCRARLSGEAIMDVSRYLFRGQSNSAWKLETTLERFTDKEMSLAEYYEIAYSEKARIETFTGNTWNVMPPDKFGSWIAIPDVFLHFPTLQGLEYLAYLRHHGYPSPLLDWTASPYIAAFFAFRDVAPSVESVSVYVYLEMALGIKVMEGNGSTIHTQWPNGAIHQRHFIQQSGYTICTRSEGRDLVLSDHEEARMNAYYSQDLVWKLNLPRTERRKAFEVLSRMNINAYSLFLTIDSLMDAAAASQRRLVKK